MSNKSVVPPNSAAATITIKGHTYASTDGTPVTMPDAHALIAAANKWSIVADWFAEANASAGAQGAQGAAGAQGAQGAAGAQGAQGAAGAQGAQGAQG